MRFHSLGFVLSSALLTLSLFLPLTWNFIPYEVTWSFPFYDASCKCFSLNPGTYKTYPIQTIAPYYYAFRLCPLYIYVRGLIPVMKVNIGFNVNIWAVHFIYVSFGALDLFISMLRTPYFRTFFIIVGCALQVKWLLGRD